MITPGTVYVTQGSDRRSTGTHYTPRSLTEPIVQHTLDPLVYHGPAEGLPQRAMAAALRRRHCCDLKVCDMAMGSGAFLVQACRYLAEQLVEAWETGRATLQRRTRVARHAGGRTSRRVRWAKQLLPRDAEERLAAGAAPCRRTLPLRRGQEPDGRGDGQALALADHAGRRTAPSPFSTTPCAAATRCSAWTWTPVDALVSGREAGQVTQHASITKPPQRGAGGSPRSPRQISTAVNARDAEEKARLLRKAEDAMALVARCGSPDRCRSAPDPGAASGIRCLDDAIYRDAQHDEEACAAESSRHRLAANVRKPIPRCAPKRTPCSAAPALPLAVGVPGSLHREAG